MCDDGVGLLVDLLDSGYFGLSIMCECVVVIGVELFIVLMDGGGMWV